VVSATDPYGRILGSLDRRYATEAKNLIQKNYAITVLCFLSFYKAITREQRSSSRSGHVCCADGKYYNK
jgi:hypothetical protein